MSYFNSHISHHSDDIANCCQLISTRLTLEKRLLCSPEPTRMGTKYYREYPCGPPQPIRTSPEVTSCMVTLHTSFFCCKWPYWIYFLKFSLFFLFFSTLLLLKVSAFFSSRVLMCIAHLDICFLSVLWIVVELSSSDWIHMSRLGLNHRLFQNSLV